MNRDFTKEVRQIEIIFSIISRWAKTNKDHDEISHIAARIAHRKKNNDIMKD